MRLLPLILVAALMVGVSHAQDLDAGTDAIVANANAGLAQLRGQIRHDQLVITQLAGYLKGTCADLRTRDPTGKPEGCPPPPSPPPVSPASDASHVAPQ